MKNSFVTLAALLVTLCATSTALAETQAPASDATVKVTVLNMPQLHYSATQTGETRPEIIQPPQNQVISIGQDLKIEFIFTGTPEPLVTAYHDGVKIINNTKYKLSVDDGKCTLLIRNVAPEDMGIYTFKIKNNLGEASVSVRLTIIE